MSNSKKSTSRFSSRRFVFAIALMVFSAGAAQAENRSNAGTVTVQPSPLATLVGDVLEVVCRLTGGHCGGQENLPEANNIGPATEGEIDTEIEIEPPPSYP